METRAMRSRSWKSNGLAFLGLLFLLDWLFAPVIAVKEYDFKTCASSGFCTRNREYADHGVGLGSTWASPYKLDASSASVSDGRLQAVVLKTTAQGEIVRLPLVVSFLKSGTARVTMDEERRQQKDITMRHGSTARKERYNEAQNLVLVGNLTLDKDARVSSQDKSGMVIQYGPSHHLEASIQFFPLQIDFKRDGVTHVKLNDRGLLNLEHWRPKVERPPPPQPVDSGTDTEGAADGEKQESANEGLDESTWWEEDFRGNSDSKPKGPESIALDITFHDYGHVYGIPSHAGPLSLKETRGGEGQYSEPYRLYNLDVFEYILDSPMTLYGSIPFMQAHRKDSSVAVFWLNAAETWIDITKSKDATNPLALGAMAKTTTRTHWMSEAGLLDVFVFLGPSPRDLTQSYGELTGYTTMPQEFALGYHQCRWNYMSDEDLRDVDRRMDQHSIPYDVLWLDIEHTDDRKYLTWHPDRFRDSLGTGRQLDAHGRKLVTIVDPHIKKVDGYAVSTDIRKKDLVVRDKNGQQFEGWCWPGASNWIDTFNPAAVDYWKTRFKYDTYIGSMENTFTWNDMNEPSVFNGPEVTMPKDNLHHGNWEHREVHNLMGMTFHNATYQAQLSRKPGELRRPFVLSRAFFAGSQRFGAVWTGDNQASWGHLAASFPMVLSQSVAGYPFVGADVGGFSGNPDLDLQARWYQAGAFYPFFRGHSHIDTRRREPYLAGVPYTGIITAAIRLRYSLLPAWYTAFFQAHRDGSPIVRPMFWTHPHEPAGFDVDDQFFVGSTGLLAKPVVTKDQESVVIWLPDDETYYDYFTYEVATPTSAPAGQRTVTLDAPLDRIPLLMRGGHIFPRRDRPRRSSALMRFDDYTLVVVVGRDGGAEGDLYVDDGESFGYAAGQYVNRHFVLHHDKADAIVLRSTDAEGRDRTATAGGTGTWAAAFASVAVDRVTVVGAPASWAARTEAIVESGGRAWTAPMQYYAADGKRAAFAVVGRVGAPIGQDFEIRFG